MLIYRRSIEIDMESLKERDEKGNLKTPRLKETITIYRDDVVDVYRGIINEKDNKVSTTGN